MTDVSTEYGRRLRDLEAEAFRTGRTLAAHSRRQAAGGEPQDHASGSVAQRLEAIERSLSALVRAQGIDVPQQRPDIDSERPTGNR